MIVRPGDRFDRMRLALGSCSMLPGSNEKRAARQFSQMYFERVSQLGWCYIVVLARRYRRQMPSDLIPSAGEAEAAQTELTQLRAARQAERQAKREARPKRTARRLVDPGMPRLDLAERA